MLDQSKNITVSGILMELFLALQHVSSFTGTVVSSELRTNYFVILNYMLSISFQMFKSIGILAVNTAYLSPSWEQPS